ncbi:MAG: MBL fold metallo-hydrolase, partial [Candidatus Binatia bacterium]
VHDARSGVVVDPVLDYDPKSARTSFRSAEAVAQYIEERHLAIPYVIDTHAHADHLTAMPFFKKRFGARTVTGSRVGEVQRSFRDIYNLGADFPVDGRQFDLLLDEGQELEIGSFRVRAMHTPGHTPAHMSWQIEDALFVGDTLFMPDYGTARCDFPGGSAEQLCDSIQRIYALPENTRLFMCHDYQPGGRECVFSRPSPSRSAPIFSCAKRRPNRNLLPSEKAATLNSTCPPLSCLRYRSISAPDSFPGPRRTELRI